MSVIPVLFPEASEARLLSDPSFGRNREVRLHRWVPWVAGFSAQFVQDCLRTYGNPSGRLYVLDPFAGVGTTLVESYLWGADVAGFEINPYAALACRVKLNAALIPVRALRTRIGQFERFMSRATEPKSKPPEGFKGRTQLFSPFVERKVLRAKDFISAIVETPLREMFQLALGSVMVSFSNYTYEPSLTRRTSVGKAEVRDAGVAEIVAAKLYAMLADIEELQADMKSRTSRPRATIFNNTVMLAEQHLGSSEKIDLVITSPPYLNNYHYPRNTRPQLHWLGLANGRGYGNANEQLSFGKFWQTVRAEDAVPLRFQFPKLEQTIATIRSANAKQPTYGGPGWANYAATYFNDTYRFCEILRRLMKPKATAVIVLGNSILQGVNVQTDQYFGEIAEMVGWGFEKTILLRKKRTGSSIIQSGVRVDKAPAQAVLYEAAIVLRA